MRRLMVAGHAVVLAALASSGCENRPTVVLGSQTSPDGRYTIWVTQESGGIISEVTRIHLAAAGGGPEAVNQILSTPDCEETTVSWADNDTVLIAYRTISATFESELRAAEPKVILVRQNDVEKLGFQVQNALPIPCDPL